MTSEAKCGEWVKYSERLPEYTVDVLVKLNVYPLLEMVTVAFRLQSTDKFWGCHNFTYQDDDNSIRNTGRISKYSITHWCELPTTEGLKE